MPENSKRYDSNDPKLPNLPPLLLHTNESDEFSEDEDQLNDTINERNTSVMASAVPKSNNASSKKSKKKHKRRNNHNRRYSNTYSSSQARERISWEPGIDINSTKVILASLGSSVTITDYNQDRYRVETIDVETTMGVDADDSELEESDDDSKDGIKNQEKESRNKLKIKTESSCSDLKDLLSHRPNWSKVRWINVNGISWETIVTLANHFNLHNLGIEDLIDIPTRTKIDFYPNCLFGVIALTKLVKETRSERINSDYSWLSTFFTKNDESIVTPNYNQIKSHNYEKLTINEKLTKFYKMRHLNDSFKPTLNSKDFYSKRKRRNTKYLNSQKPLSYRNLFVGVEQCSFFLLKNGIILTFFESSGDDIENAILSRISKSETILRRSCDASILLQNIIDSIVDIIYPILTAYRKRLDEFEIEALMNPNLSHTRALHLLYGELKNLRGQILPITAMINSIRELAEQHHVRDKTRTSTSMFHDDSLKLISPISEVYFADIVDHTLMFTSEIESMIDTTQNLINLIFNTISTDTNNSMKQLSWITVIFLPMSFWTGYYGMNFDIFGDLNNSVSLYWKISIPFSFGLVCLLTWSVVKNYFKKLKALLWDLTYVISLRLKKEKIIDGSQELHDV